MRDLSDYALSDFLMFSPEVYYRLFVLYNREVWPAQLLMIGLGLVMLYLFCAPLGAKRRIIPALLGGIWIWVAWAFLWERFAAINWPIIYIAPAYALQGLLLIGMGVGSRQLYFGRPENAVSIAGLMVFVAALCVYPFIAPLTGRAWLSAEIFGLAPDPTAIATLALLALARGRIRWLLMILPIFWCAISSLTLWAMGQGDFFLPIAGALTALGIALLRVLAR